MLRQIAFPALLVIVAGSAALITQTLVFGSSSSSRAAVVHQGNAADATLPECAKATWPDIPPQCLEGSGARNITTIVFASK